MEYQSQTWSHTQPTTPSLLTPFWVNQYLRIRSFQGPYLEGEWSILNKTKFYSPQRRKGLPDHLQPPLLLDILKMSCATHMSSPSSNSLRELVQWSASRRYSEDQDGPREERKRQKKKRERIKVKDKKGKGKRREIGRKGEWRGEL